MGTGEEKALLVWEMYNRAAAEVGYEAGPPEHGYLVKCHVAETKRRHSRARASTTS